MSLQPQNTLRGDLHYQYERSELDAWPPDLPEDYRQVEAHWADCASCSETLCQCGRPMVAIGFRKESSYRCFCVCPSCNLYQEI